jgi:hypothetical protein
MDLAIGHPSSILWISAFILFKRVPPIPRSTVADRCLIYSGSVMRGLHLVSSRLLAWVVIARAMALYGQQVQPVAGVLNVNGSWQLEGQQGPVRAGQKLYPGDKLSTAPYNYANWITIVHYNDGSRTRIACENSPKNPCHSSVLVNAPNPTDTSQALSLIKAAFDLLVGNPPEVLSHDSPTIGRGKYVVALREDVVNLDGEKGLSLKGRIPVLPAGIYTIETSKSDGNRIPIKAQISTEVDGSWQSSVAVPAPGLYTVTIKDSEGELRANLLILFVKASQYDSARQAFEAIKNEAETWQGANAEADENILLRATLLAMSKSI